MGSAPPAPRSYENALQACLDYGIRTVVRAPASLPARSSLARFGQVPGCPIALSPYALGPVVSRECPGGTERAGVCARHPGLTGSARAERFRHSESVEEAADWYRVDPDDVRAAIEFEPYLAA